MARRNNNAKFGTSWATFSGPNGLTPNPAYYWNRRGPRVNQTEGSPSKDTSKWLLPDFILDDDALPARYPIQIAQALTKEPFFDSDDISVTPTSAVEDESQPPLEHGLVRRLKFVPPLIDEDISVAPPPVDDESIETARRRAPSTKAVLRPVSDYEPAFVVAEEDGKKATATLRRPLVALHQAADEDRTATVAEDDGEKLPAILLAAATVPARPLAEDELAFVVAEEDGRAATTTLYSPVAPPARPQADDDRITAALEEDGGKPATTLCPATRPPSRSAAEDDLPFVTSEEDASRITILRLVPPLNARPAGIDNDLPFTVAEEDGKLQHVAAPGSLARPLPTTDGDEITPPPSVTALDDETSQVVRPRLRLVVPSPHTAPDDDIVPTPPPPPPPTRRSGEPTKRSSASGAWPESNLHDPFDKYREDNEAETEAAPFAVVVVATALPLQIHATLLPMEIVERGNLIHLLAPFEGPPDEVYFSYTMPDSERPIVDPGFGRPGSHIARVKNFNRDSIAPELLDRFERSLENGGLFVCTIDSTGARGGKLIVHFWGTGKFQASGFEEIEIPARPRQLL